jgi:hypothetical protein
MGGSMDALLTAVTAKSALLGYIDPGTGSLIFQVVAASVVSAGLFFKGARQKLMWTFYKVFGSKEVGASECEASEARPLDVSRKAA